jgi:predicted AAA+ superfamily ATPase
MRSLQGYTELYLEEEIRREGLVRDIGPFSRFLELAALESGKTMNLVKLSNESGIPITTLRTYYQVLIDTFVGYWLEPFATRNRKRLLTTPKFFLFDLGVRNAAARLPLNETLIRLHGGELLEHWVGLELIHRVRLLGAGYRVGFWRTVGGAEVDFVVQTPKEIIAIEVKWTDKPSPSDARHLELFLKGVPKGKGFVVCRVKEPRALTPRVQAIPWSDL